MLQILKLGGSVITDKNRYTTPKMKAIKRLIKEVINAKRKKNFKLILVNGAGSFGHMPVERYKLKEGIRDEKTKFGLTVVHKYVEDLNRIIWDCLREKNIAAVPVHPSSFVIQKEGKVIRFDTTVIKKLLDFDIIPLLYGDIVMDTKKGCSIISGDYIVPYLARKFKADKILMGTDTNGIFDKNPAIYKDAKQIKEVNNENYEEVLKRLGGSRHIDVTGGMKEKLRKIVEESMGTECVIYDANVKGNTERVLLGEKIGTVIKVK